ncbi:precorrin-3B C(17)-methyltransferase [Geminocystis sp. NIES-3709]|uniref:precorrin-3B C(17)-methyltransferase n=1 Tax=Geminocystis sp. NIES-3709 TaxID=1617448 RepID=UPI0005FC5432|nr:precorrin-3B C(17)-methyltransferase [Geminocystis sp. NIES-3709]BAQ64831.1 cobalamin biosynthesis protein CbiG [Geminocystis sp. NIES-3709]
MSILFTDFSPLNFITVTEKNAIQLQSLVKISEGILWLPEKLKISEKLVNLQPNSTLKNTKYYHESLSQHLANIWENSEGIIFSLTIGAVVRLVSPLLTNKKKDPAIIVIDPHTKYVISLLGGHQANADKLTELIAHQLDAKAIITSASYNLNLPSIDTFGNIFGWQRGKGNWTEVSINIARNLPTLIRQDLGLNWWQNSLPSSHPFIFENTKDSKSIIRENTEKAMVYIGAEKPPNIDIPCVSWHPRILWVGIGCERDTSPSLIESAVTQVLDKYNLERKSIASLATIDLKKDELGILMLGKKWGLALHTFTAEELNSVAVPNPSSIVKEEVGTPSVAEASALKSALLPNLRENQQKSPHLIVPKQIIRQEGEKGAVTVAIARSNVEYNPNKGKLYLIGTGPGSIEYLTSVAKTALREADIIIGYSLYIDLIKSLLRPEQIIESSPITQERQRAERAIELAKWGLKVAVISSGDCGIYGMAGLVLEILQNQNWDGKQPPVEVFSGITAMQSVAAKIGSPLMHDFCAISLSDLLTPWEVIEKRITAAASADFITAIYNPRSQTRTQQIITTQKIFLEYRKPHTPVAIARSVTRDDENIIITTLGEMLNHSIDMVTTVIIGNSSTKRYHDLLITPRGYLASPELSNEP